MKKEYKTPEKKRAYYYAHTAERRAYQTAYNAAHRDELRSKKAVFKIEAFNAYGGPVCACCGETLFEGLTIDHIGGGGEKHRVAIGGGGEMMYRWLKKNNYPPGFQVLCYTCNCAKGSGDHCPHKDRRQTAT